MIHNEQHQGTRFETVHNDPSSSSKVVDFGTDRKRVCVTAIIPAIKWHYRYN